ncbi:MAG: L-2-amino-thiazoline-4-carboxylic acid hydrolase [Bacteroidetes bacterium]|nr:L-2-amino-thiazoline-4-carboxylic acid hydrolase [Bacteroidota bacterium]
MEKENKLKMLQYFYAGVMVDALSNYENFGITAEVTDKKRLEQVKSAKAQLEQLAIHSPEELFDTFSQLFGCVEWKLEKKEDCLDALAYGCLLCTMAKKKGTPRPCNMYCIQPLEALASAFETSWNLQVIQTLWEGNRCHFHLEPQES